MSTRRRYSLGGLVLPAPFLVGVYSVCAEGLEWPIVPGPVFLAVLLVCWSIWVGVVASHRGVSLGFKLVMAIGGAAVIVTSLLLLGILCFAVSGMEGVH